MDFDSQFDLTDLDIKLTIKMLRGQDWRKAILDENAAIVKEVEKSENLKQKQSSEDDAINYCKLALKYIIKLTLSILFYPGFLLFTYFSSVISKLNKNRRNHTINLNSFKFNKVHNRSKKVFMVKENFSYDQNFKAKSISNEFSKNHCQFLITPKKRYNFLKKKNQRSEFELYSAHYVSLKKSLHKLINDRKTELIEFFHYEDKLNSLLSRIELTQENIKEQFFSKSHTFFDIKNSKIKRFENKERNLMILLYIVFVVTNVGVFLGINYLLSSLNASIIEENFLIEFCTLLKKNIIITAVPWLLYFYWDVNGSKSKYNLKKQPKSSIKYYLLIIFNFIMFIEQIYLLYYNPELSYELSQYGLSVNQLIMYNNSVELCFYIYILSNICHILINSIRFLIFWKIKLQIKLENEQKSEYKELADFPEKLNEIVNSSRNISNLFIQILLLSFGLIVILRYGEFGENLQLIGLEINSILLFLLVETIIGIFLAEYFKFCYNDLINSDFSKTYYIQSFFILGLLTLFFYGTGVLLVIMAIILIYCNQLNSKLLRIEKNTVQSLITKDREIKDQLDNQNKNPNRLIIGLSDIAKLYEENFVFTDEFLDFNMRNNHNFKELADNSKEINQIYSVNQIKDRDSNSSLYIPSSTFLSIIFGPIDEFTGNIDLNSEKVRNFFSSLEGKEVYVMEQNIALLKNQKNYSKFVEEYPNLQLIPVKKNDFDDLFRNYISKKYCNTFFVIEAANEISRCLKSNANVIVINNIDFMFLKKDLQEFLEIHNDLYDNKKIWIKFVPDLISEPNFRKIYQFQLNFN